MKKTIILLMTLIGVNVSSTAQQHPGFSKLLSYSADTALSADFVSAIKHSSNSNISYAALQCYRYLIPALIYNVFYKIDATGQIIAEVKDSIPNANLGYQSVQESEDEQFLFWGGGTFHYLDTLAFWRLTKTDKDLNIIWQKEYPTAVLDAYIMDIHNIPNTTDLMLLCRGFTVENNWGKPIIPPRIYLMRVDSSGNMLDIDTPGAAGNWDNCSKMAPTNDHGYMVTGRTFSWGQSNGSGYAMKVDSAGNEVWHQVYNQGIYSGWPYNILKVNEGSATQYLIGGTLVETADFSIGRGFVLLTDEQGNELWRKLLSYDVNKNNTIWNICHTYSKHSYGAIGNTDIDLNGATQRRGWAVKLDKDGNEVWSNLLTANPRPSDHEYLYHIVPLPDGGFLAAGSSWGQDAYGRWTQEGWLVRLDSNGCYTPDCSNGGVGIREPEAHPKPALSIYPNPVKDKVHIQLPTGFAAQSFVYLLDSKGRPIKPLAAPQPGSTNYTANLSNLPSGIYFLQIISGEHYWQEKVVLVGE